MPSTYSPNLRIELIAPGEQSGTWGTTTNINLGTVLEDAVSGFVAVTTSSGNQPLTALNGSQDQARNAILELNTSSGGNYNVYVPPVEKVYIVKNVSTTYTATIYCSTSLGNVTPKGAGVAIPPTKALLIFTDGTDVRLGYDFYSFSGTTNQVNVTNTNGNIVFSLPQSINTGASVQFDTLSITSSTTLTGTTSVPTAAENTSTQAIASTAFVDRLRSLSTPTTSSAGGTLVIGDRGSLVSVTGGVTVPANIFSARDVVSIYNNTSGALTITQGAALTLRLAGTTLTGNRNLATRGLATVVFVSATEAIISGGGVT